MSKKKSFLTFIQEKMQEYENLHGPLSDNHNKFILLGVEFDEDDFPTILLNRAVNNYVTHIAGLDLLQDMIDEDYENTKKKINHARSKSDIVSTPSAKVSRDAVEKMVDSLQARLKSIMESAKPKSEPDTPKKDEPDSDLMNQIKSQFGFDGESAKDNGSFTVEGFSDPKDDGDDD